MHQHFNLLWSRERLTGVVDWSEACIGPPGVDVGLDREGMTRRMEECSNAPTVSVTEVVQ